MEALGKYLTPDNLPLESIFLDPNNPRFTGSDWAYVADDRVPDRDVQNTATDRLVKSFSVNKLRLNMEVNGYLPIDRIVVRSIGTDKYVVLEGNRRICAAKSIGEFDADGEEISDDVRSSLETIPALVYTGDNTGNEAAWIFQGLRHITGHEDWTAFHKAKLLVEQMEKESLSLTNVGKRFGLSSHGAGQWVRGYHAYRQTRADTDFQEAVDDRIYPYLQELFGRSSIAIREWLEWNEGEYKFDNIANLNEFVSWFYPQGDVEEGEEPTASSEDWENRLIVRRDDIRQLAYLYQNAPKEWLQFRHDGDLEAAYSRAQMARYEEESSDSNRVGELFDLIERCAKAISETPVSVIRNDTTLATLKAKLKELKSSIAMVDE